MGYFAGLQTALYRRTKDGQQVTARRMLVPWVRRWFVVTPAQTTPYERRVKWAHLISMGTMILCILLISMRNMHPAWFVVPILIAPLWGVVPWVTSGLTPANITAADLEPVDRTVIDLRFARATGARTLWVCVVAGIALGAGQLMVVITDGVWWSWLGLAMFSASTIYMGMLLWKLRSSGAPVGRSTKDMNQF